MLRAYEYNENVDLLINHKEPSISAKEISLAKQIVAKIQKKYPEAADKKQSCPICSGENTEVFYHKWNETYRKCSKCKSIYCDCTRERLKSYVLNEDLVNYRVSKKYQQDAVARRKETWEETIKWLQFRSFRYLGYKNGITVLDFGNRYEGFIKAIKAAPFVSEYHLKESILPAFNAENEEGTNVDLLLYMNVLQQEKNPEKKLLELHKQIRKDGLFVISSRAGSGFDILTLQENHQYIYPYEHITLPSVEGLIGLLGKTGYEVLEVTTPGSMDVGYVYANRQDIKDENIFLKTMIEEQNERTLQEFQRFLQKNCMSSYVQIIARRI